MFQIEKKKGGIVLDSISWHETENVILSQSCYSAQL